MEQCLPRTGSFVTGGSMSTVRSPPVSTQQLRELLVRLEDQAMEESVLLLEKDWTVLGLCLTAGVQARGTLTVLTMDCAVLMAVLTPVWTGQGLSHNPDHPFNLNLGHHQDQHPGLNQLSLKKKRLKR